MQENILNYGRAEDLPGKRVLRAGKLSMVYQNGFIRSIQCGRFEIIRMINHALRDANWGTCPFEIRQERIQEKEDAFQVSYDAVIRDKDIAFTWTCTIDGHADGRVVFEIRGVAGSSFQKNRAGFTVLHPLRECVGQAVEIVQTDGSLLSGIFPESIAPHQPFKQIKAMHWRVHDAIKAELNFEGDVFEMEDQRNWMDASYKTYCTPLDLPFPVQLSKGDEVHQKIVLKVDAGKDQADPMVKDEVVLTLSEKRSPFPLLGLCKSSEVEQLSDSQLERLRRLDLDGYRVDVHLSDPAWQDHLRQACGEAQALGCPIELGLFMDEQHRDIGGMQLDPEIVDRIGRVTLYSDDEKTIPDAWIEAVIESARRLFPRAKIGAGTDAFFTELNRSRIHSDRVDYLSFSTNPQVHASDNDSWVETLEAIPYLMSTCTGFAGNKGVQVSPLTFKMRWNPNATGAQPEDPAGTIPWNADVRQMARFGAAWTLGALKHFAESGAESITLFETVGIKGLMPHEAASLHPFNLMDPYPLFDLMETILAYKHHPVLSCASDQPLKCEALCFDAEDHIQVILANYTGQHLKVHLPDNLEARKVAGVLGRLPEGTFSDQLTMGPYQVVRMEWSTVPELG